MGFTISRTQGAGKTTITVTPEEKNTTEQDIVKILTVEAVVDGSRKQVKLIHRAGEAVYEYDFRITPTELRFGKDGGSKSVTIVSTKQKIVNGKKVGTPVPVNYTRVNSGDVSGSDTTITMTAATSIINQKQGQVTYTQAESNKVLTINCIQDADEKETVIYTFDVQPIAFQSGSDGGNYEVAIVSYKEEYVNGQLAGRTDLGYKRVNGEGASGTGTAITIAPNEGYYDSEGVYHSIERSVYVTYTQDESGEVRNVIFSQDAPVPSNYEFLIKSSASDPDTDYSTSITYKYPSGSGGPSYSPVIKSTKDGEKFPNWTMASDSDWIETRDDGNSWGWTVKVNSSTSARVGKITFTQAESNKKVYINIEQAGVAYYTVKLNWVDSGYREWQIVKGNPTSLKRESFAAYTPNADSPNANSYPWNTNMGLLCSPDSGNSGGTTTAAHIGDTLSILVWYHKDAGSTIPSDQEGKVMKTFTLEDKDQEFTIDGTAEEGGGVTPPAKERLLKITGLNDPEASKEILYLFKEHAVPSGTSGQYMALAVESLPGTGIYNGVANVGWVDKVLVNESSPSVVGEVLPGEKISLWQQHEGASDGTLTPFGTPDYTLLDEDVQIWDVRG